MRDLTIDVVTHAWRGVAIDVVGVIVGSLVSLEGVNRPVKTKLELLSNSTRSTAALCPRHYHATTLPSQNSGTATPADNFVM